MGAIGPTGAERLFAKQVNLYRLHEYIDRHVSSWAPTGVRFIFSEDIVQRLHSVAMSGLIDTAGTYRKGNVEIKGARHQCPGWQDVPAHMKSLVGYVNENWEKRDLVHLAAYVMWRLCWIHPFENGNGRTARGASYLVLCAKYGKLLPPKNSIIEQIMRDKLNQGGNAPYYRALDAVDQEYIRNPEPATCCGPLELLLGHMLKEQIKASF